MIGAAPQRSLLSASWAGPLPAAWRVARVRHLAHIFAGGTPDRRTETYWTDGTIPWLNSGAVNQVRIKTPSRYITEEAFRDSSAKWIPKDSLVVALAGQGRTKGMVAQLEIDSTCNQSMAAIVPGAVVTGRFLFWWLTANYATIRNLAGSELRDGLNLDIVGDIPCPLPGLHTQRAIADYLDRETARIDAVIVAKRRMVALVEERYRVARIDLVIDRDAPRRRSGPVWLGSMPTTWQLSRLRYVARMESGHTPSRQVDAYWVDCTIPWMTLNDVGDLEQGWWFLRPKNAVNELGLQHSSAHILPANAVAMSRDATVGRSALLGVPMAVSQHFVAWICGPDLIPEYLLNVIRGPMQGHFGGLTAGATIATIGMPDLDQLVVPMPSIDVQARIVEKIAAVEKQATATLALLSRQVELLEERRRALITAAVTGQLDIPDAV